MGSQRDLHREALQENSPLWQALKARGLTLQDIIHGMATTATNAYERKIGGYLDRWWFASLRDLIGLKMDPKRILREDFKAIMDALAPAQQKILSGILQGEIAKLDRKLVIQRMVQAGKIGRHKRRYLHSDVITDSWKTAGAKIIEDLGVSGLNDVIDTFVNTIHAYELRVKEVGIGEVSGRLECKNTKGNTFHVKYREECFKVGQGGIFRTPRELAVLVEINVPTGLDKDKKRKLGIKPRSPSLRNWLY